MKVDKILIYFFSFPVLYLKRMDSISEKVLHFDIRKR